MHVEDVGMVFLSKDKKQTDPESFRQNEKVKKKEEKITPPRSGANAHLIGLALLSLDAHG